MNNNKLKILLFDLETAPMLAYVWRPTDDYVQSERLINDTWVMCWAAKWADSTKTMTGLVTPDEAIAQDDSRIVKDLAELMREADILVAHNGDRFDIPKINTRLLLMGLDPLGPVQSIDTLTLAKKNFDLPYNKLDYLAEMFGFGNKIKTGFQLWKDCYHGEEKALKQMSKYNVKDVDLLEKVFNRLKPYVKNLKRLYEPESAGEFACPFCGSNDLAKRGVYRTQSSTFQRYCCGLCGKYSRLRTSFKEKFSVVPL